MTRRNHGKTRIAVRRAPVGYAGWVVVDTHTGKTTKPYATREAAEHKAQRDRRKLGKKPAIGTRTARP